MSTCASTHSHDQWNDASALSPARVVPAKATVTAVDEALDAVSAARARLLGDPPTAARAMALAELADIEADWWAVLFEATRVRPVWRAALGAREAARLDAARWRRLAEVHTATERCGGAA